MRMMRLVARTAAAAGNTSVRLEGGTALAAYYLGHRESEDLDFFSDYGFDQRAFGDAVAAEGATEGLRFTPTGAANPTFARFLVHDEQNPADPPLKVDLGGQSPFHLAPLEETTEEIRVASYRDLTAGKLHAICDRFEARDYIDLHVILTCGVSDSTRLEQIIRVRTRSLIRDVMEIDPGLDPRIVGDAVLRGLNTPLLARFPLRLLVPLSEAELQQSLAIATSECAAVVARPDRLLD